MALIREIVQEALNIGYLSVVAEDQIQALIQTNYDSEDLDAWIILQRSIVAGDVKQESRRKQKKASLSSKSKDASANIKLAYQAAAEMAFAAAMALTMQPNNHKDQASLSA